MTGHQPHPASINAVHPISIENMVRACGIKTRKFKKLLIQDKAKKFISAVREFVEKPEVSVIIARRPCKFVTPKN